MPTVVAKREKILDLERYNSSRSEVLAGGHARLDIDAADVDPAPRPGVPATA